MSYKIVDDFLNENDFKELKSLILGSSDNANFSWNLITEVANGFNDNDYDQKIEEQLWNWYAIHPVYYMVPLSPHFDYITRFFYNKLDIKSLIRIKVNFYPYTTKVEEHAVHKDYEFRHFGAVFSLNTCDGFTRMSNGDKVDSVANRMVFFDPSEDHNSSTTSNQKGRYNINFNWF